MKVVIDGEMLALIPVGIALWFMMWVLWNWRREQRHRSDRRNQSFGASGSPHRNWE
jgi:hypothetical protein